MKLVRLLLVLAVACTVLAVFFLSVFVPVANRLIAGVLFEINLNRKLNQSEPSYQLEAWNRIYANVSTIPEYWNATVPSWMAGKSIPQVAAFFAGIIYDRSLTYPSCYIEVPELTSQALNRTLTQLGLVVWNSVPQRPQGFNVLFQAQTSGYN